MESTESLQRLALARTLSFIKAYADYMEMTAELEKATGVKTGDYSKLWSSKEFVGFLNDKIGPEGVGKLAIAFLRLASIKPDILNAPPEERFWAVKELRNIVAELEAVANSIPT